MALKRQPLERLPWDQVLLAPHDIAAIKAVFAGNASAAQQQRAMHLIVHEIAQVNRLSFTKGGEDGRRATDFAEGRRWVGATLLQIRETRTPGPRPKQAGPHAVPIGAPPSDSEGPARPR